MDYQLSYGRCVQPLILSLLVGWSTLSVAETTNPSATVAAGCAQCHIEGGAAIPGWPPLKYMTREEIKSRLKTYRDQRVPESRMSDVTHSFSDGDIDAIAEYFARERLKPH